MPLSSSSEKEDADDVISGHQEEETAFVANKTFSTSRQAMIRIPKSLQVNSNGREEMR